MAILSAVLFEPGLPLGDSAGIGELRSRLPFLRGSPVPMTWSGIVVMPFAIASQGWGPAGGANVGQRCSRLGRRLDVLQTHLAASHRLAILGTGNHDLPELLGAALLDRLGNHVEASLTLGA